MPFVKTDQGDWKSQWPVDPRPYNAVYVSDHLVTETTAAKDVWNAVKGSPHLPKPSSCDCYAISGTADLEVSSGIEINGFMVHAINHKGHERWDLLITPVFNGQRISMHDIIAAARILDNLPQDTSEWRGRKRNLEKLFENAHVVVSDEMGNLIKAIIKNLKK